MRVKTGGDYEMDGRTRSERGCAIVAATVSSEHLQEHGHELTFQCGGAARRMLGTVLDAGLQAPTLGVTLNSLG